MTKRLWQIHSWLGLIAGLGLLLIGFTGSVLVFRTELEALAHPSLTHVAPAPAGRLAFDALLASAQRQLPRHEIVGWVIQPDAPSRPDLLWVIAHGSTNWNFAPLDPYRGKLLSPPREETSTVTGWLLELHTAFFADHVGLVVTGMLAVMLCLLSISGVWIYREFWKHVFTLRWGRGARILFSDLHKFVGITSVLFNLLLGFTGAYWNLTHVIGEEIAGTPEPPPMTRRLYGAQLSLDALVADARTRVAGFRANYISLPWMSDVDITLYGAPTDAGPLRSPYGTHFTYDPQTGAHKTTHDLRVAGVWAQIVDAFTPLHFGSFGGLAVKLLWCLGGLAPGALSVTGFTIWWQRRKRRATPPLPDTVQAGLAAPPL
ncbi:MAG TPA: PepSY-associated TM helix domain-containing protein [Acidobacteriota bacterium]|nr:PepSY-associated TM helix domain-containing protein [Acidobacteriota bacterium]